MAGNAQFVPAVTPDLLEVLVARERQVEADLVRARDEADRLLERAREEAREILAQAQRCAAEGDRARRDELLGRQRARTEAVLRSLEADIERLSDWPEERAEELARALLRETFGAWDEPAVTPRGR